MLIPHYKLGLDINESVYRGQEIVVRKGDVRSRYIDITLYAGNEQIVLNKERVTLTVADEDGTFALSTCTVANGIITAELTEAMLAKPGVIDCELTVYGTTNVQVLTAVRFTVNVVDTLSTEVVERTQSFSALQRALSDVASTSNRIDEVATRTQPISLGGTGATTAYDAAQNLKVPFLAVSQTVPTGADLNAYTTPGTHDIAAAIASSIVHGAFSSGTYKLYIFATSLSGYINQLAVHPANCEICTRVCVSGEWSEWRKITSQAATIAETGTWTPTPFGDASFVVDEARYYYNGYTVTVEAKLTLSENITNYLSVTGLPINLNKSSSIAGSGFIFSSGASLNVAALGDQRKITIRSAESLSNKTIVIGLTYIL